MIVQRSSGSELVKPGEWKISPRPAAAAEMCYKDSEVVECPQWLEGMERTNEVIQLAVNQHHNRSAGPNECCSVMVQEVRAPIETVWSVVRKFDQPQSYKRFLRSCSCPTAGDDVKVGCTREVTVISGLPATTSTEQLEVLDDDKYILSFKILGGDHRLRNYRSVTTLHPTTLLDGRASTVVMESYVVEIPEGNSEEETRTFSDTVVKFNLQSLARTCEQLV